MCVKYDGGREGRTLLTKFHCVERKKRDGKDDNKNYKIKSEKKIKNKVISKTKRKEKENT